MRKKKKLFSQFFPMPIKNVKPKKVKSNGKYILIYKKKKIKFKQKLQEFK